VLTEFAEDFFPIGVRLRVVTNSREVLEACRASFGGYEAPDAGLETPLFIIRLLSDETLSAAPPWPEPVFHRRGDIFRVSIGSDNRAKADLRDRHASGSVSPAMARDTNLLQRAFVECLALTMMTRGKGATHTYLHASAVARGKRGLVLSGPRESGKSTLACACVRRGFHIVTDDVVYLKTEPALTAWGRPWRLRLLPDCARFFPELGAAATDLKRSAGDIVEIDVREFWPGQTRVCCEPVALLFLGRSTGRSSCEPLETDEALKRLERDAVYDAPEVLQRHRRVWTQLAARGSFILRCGQDLDEAVDLLEHCLRA
jgi:hypothetical protein